MMEESEEKQAQSQPRSQGRTRSMAGIDGISAAQPVYRPAALSVAPTTADIRKARQLAARTRALAACPSCRDARLIYSFYFTPIERRLAAIF